MLPWLFVVFAQGAQLRCPREHLALLAARDDKFEDERRLEIWILVAPPSSASSVDELKVACLRGNVQKADAENTFC